jgi:hypothetical protein
VRRRKRGQEAKESLTKQDFARVQGEDTSGG